MNDANNPFAPPQAEVADVAVGATALATRGNRFLAAMADLVIQVGALWLLQWLTGWGVFATDVSLPDLAMGTLFGVASFLVIQGPWLWRRGQTLGKMMLGLRIVRSDGSRVEPLRLFGLRYGIGWGFAALPVVGALFGIIDSLLIFRESRRCLHDNIADTIVIRA